MSVMTTITFVRKGHIACLDVPAHAKGARRKQRISSPFPSRIKRVLSTRCTIQIEIVWF